MIRAALALLSFVLVTLLANVARAEDRPEIDIAKILGKKDDDALRLTSVGVRLTAYEQDGHGYQSKAGPLSGPGSQRLIVFEPQLEVRARQGERLTHRMWIPVDIVTAASPAAIDRDATTPDVISNASRSNQAGTVDWTTQYRASKTFALSMRTGIHLEEEWRAWHVGLSASQGFAEDNTVVTLGVLSNLDWLDRFAIEGKRLGVARRSSTTGSLSITQVLSPTTLAEVSYGLTVQTGELGNTWNIVPLSDGTVAQELLPTLRIRHAVVARVAQALPWNGVLKGYYRLYTDDWSILAHTFELQLFQHFGKAFHAGIGYRHHTQSSPDFFSIRANPSAPLRTADSDLASLDAESITGRLGLDLPWQESGILHFDVAYERYFRSNDLTSNIVTCSTALSF